MFCTECGQALRPGDKFCAQCGTPAASVEVPPGASAPGTLEQEESRPSPAFIRTSQSTLNVGSQPLVSGTASFHTLPGTAASKSVSEDRRPEGSTPPRSEVFDHEPTPVSSVFSYRARPSVPLDQSRGPMRDKSVPVADSSQLSTVENPLPSDSPQSTVPANPVLATQSCPACGALNHGVGRFCESCGAPLDPKAAVAESPRETPISEPAWVAKPTAPTAPIRSAFTDVEPTDAESLPYAADLPEHEGGTRLFWIVLAVLLVAGLAAIALMLRSTASPSAAAKATDGAITVTVTPALARVAPLNGLDLTATVSGTKTPDVTWTVQENGAVGHVVPRGVLANGDKLAATAVYVAPGTPGVYHVIVASKVDPSKSAVAEVTVAEAPNSAR